MKIRQPLFGLALGLLVVACSGSPEDAPPPGDVSLDDAGSDALPNDDSGTPADADTDAATDADSNTDTDADTDADTDPDADTGPDADTDSDADTDPDAGPVECNPECETGQRCDDGVCVCDADSCETGCCTDIEGGSCLSGDALDSCGQGGAQCQACDETKADACGASGACECNGGPACTVGECMGDLGCIDLETDPKNCGEVSHDCLGGPCIDGECQLTTVDISQMSDNSPGDWGVSCANTYTNITSDNSWWRRFYFEEHAEIGAAARVTRRDRLGRLLGASSDP